MCTSIVCCMLLSKPDIARAHPTYPTLSLLKSSGVARATWASPGAAERHSRGILAPYPMVPICVVVVVVFVVLVAV
jgi:hypothetical protein